MANPKSLQDYPDMLTPKMVAEIVQIGYTKALNLVKYEKDIPYIKIGNTYRINKSYLVKWLETSQKKEIILD